MLDLRDGTFRDATLLVTMLWMVGSSAPLGAQSNILVVGTNFWDPGEVREYTQGGAMLWGELVPTPVPGEEEEPRDVTVNNGIHIVQDSFFYPQAYLSRQTDWSHFTTSNWSIAPGNVSHGGLASYKHYIFATDFGRNLVRFDVSNGYAAVRFGIGIGDPFLDGIVDLNVGLDCKLYALERDGGGGLPNIDVYDPDTLEHLRTIDLDAVLNNNWDVRALAVDLNGDLFLATWEGDIHRLDSNATTVLDSLADVSEGASLLDINLNADGQIVVGARLGPVAITTTALDTVSTFEILNRMTESFFVSWTTGEDCTELVTVFTDGFESGDTSAWSGAVP